MDFRENLRLAWSCVRSNRMRSFLTMLGIIIGISAVITITTIGSSLKQSIATSVYEMAGVNTLYAYISSDDYREAEKQELPHITLDDLQLFQQTYQDDIEAVGAEMELGDGVYEAGNGKYELKFSVTGETGSVLKTYGVDTFQGRPISLQDSIDARHVAVVSDAFAKYAFDGKDPIGEKISLKLENGINFDVYVIGVYEYDVNKIGRYSDRGKPLSEVETTIFVPLNYVYDLAGVPKSEREAYFFNVIAKPGKDPDMIIAETEMWFNTNCMEPDSLWYLEVESLEKQLNRITSMLNVITVAISIIAAISLIVGGIGVMNIMLVSVTERTREIGLKKALGARKRAVLGQFLTEAAVLTSLGGIIGVGAGIGLAYFISKVALVPVAISIPAIIISVVFSMLIGIIFGLIPSIKAANLSPIDALRYE